MPIAHLKSCSPTKAFRHTLLRTDYACSRCSPLTNRNDIWRLLTLFAAVSVIPKSLLKLSLAIVVPMKAES